jgi:hypothetical protein
VTVLIDDQLLSAVLRGQRPGLAVDDPTFTTGCWYVRLCQAVVSRTSPGKLSTPIRALPDHLQERAVAAIMELPPEIGLLSLRTIGPLIGRLRRRYHLNILGMEALAAAKHLDARVLLSSHSPELEHALRLEGLRVETT